MKMIGTAFDRSVPRISSASSKPSMVGMWMSSSASAKSCTNNNSSAAGPDVALWISRSSPASSASSASRFSSTSSTSRHLTLSTIVFLRDVSVRPQQVAERCRVDLDALRHRVERGGRHGDHFRAFKLLHRSQAAGGRNRAQSRGPVRIRTRQDDTQDPFTIGLRGRLEQYVDRGARVVHPLVLRKGEGAALFDQQVIVGGGEIDLPADDGFLVLG